MLESILESIRLQRLEDQFTRSLGKPVILMKFSDVVRNVHKLCPQDVRRALESLPAALVSLEPGEERWSPDQIVDWFKNWRAQCAASEM